MGDALQVALLVIEPLRHPAQCGSRGGGSLLGLLQRALRREPHPLRPTGQPVVAARHRGEHLVAQPLGQRGQLGAGLLHTQVGEVADARPHRVGALQEPGDALHQRRGTRSGGLQRGVRHLVGDAAVDLVTEPGEHRQRRGGDGHRDGLGVERGQFATTATTADEHERVEVGMATQFPQCTGDLGHRRGTLHAHVDQPQHERQAAALDLVHEVGPGGTVATGDHADAQRRQRQCQRPVALEQARLAQSAQHVVALQGQFAEREARVDAAHLQAQGAAAREEVEMAVDAHLQPVGQMQPVLQQQRAQLVALRREELHAHHGLAGLGDLHQPEVRVRAALVPSLDLTAHPHAALELRPEHAVDGVGQLGHRVRGVEFLLGLERECPLAHGCHHRRKAGGPSGCRVKSPSEVNPTDE